jgi:hypothetical protein
MSRKQKRVFEPLVIMLALVLSACVAAWATMGRARRTIQAGPESTKMRKISVTNGSTTAITSLTTQQTISPRGPVQNVRFTIYDGGIYPRQLHAKTGNVAIAIEDRSSGSMGLLIERQDGSVNVVVGQVTRLINRQRARAQIRLDIGRYRVVDASRPNNRAELLVEP